MEKEKIIQALKTQLEGNYLSQREIRYGKSAGLFLSPYEYKKFLEYKESIASPGGEVSLLPLRPFNSTCLYYCLGNDLKGLVDKLIKSNRVLIPNNDLIFDEIEGSLNIEGVPVRKDKIKELLEMGAPY